MHNTLSTSALLKTYFVASWGSILEQCGVDWCIKSELVDLAEYPCGRQKTATPKVKLCAHEYAGGNFHSIKYLTSNNKSMQKFT